LGIAGVLLFPLGFYFLFKAGTIFHLFSFYCIAPLTLLALQKYLEEGKVKWVMGFGVLFLIASLVHSLTFMYLVSTLTIFLIGKALYTYTRGNSLKRLILPLIFLGLSLFAAWSTWGSSTTFLIACKSSPLLSASKSEMAIHFSVVGYFLGPTALLFLSGLALAVLDKSKNYILNQPITFMLASCLIALTCGFILTGHERILYDLSILLTLSGLTLIGIYIKGFNFKVPIHRLVAICIIPLLVVLAAGGTYGWTRDYTTYREVDRELVTYLQGIPSNANILVSPQIHPQIYMVFTNDITFINWNYRGDLEEYDYFVFRDEYMDCKIEYYGQEFPPFNLPGGLTLEKEFEAEDIRIEVYKVGQEEKE